METNLNQLKVFHVTAKKQSFTRAAEALFLTQPGISKYIKDLEAYYGMRLFDRLGKKIVLTQAGEILYAKTEIIFQIIDQLKVELDELQGMDRGTLNIGASITFGVYVLPAILSKFRARHPRVDISLDIALNRQVADNVIANKVDIGFLGSPVRDERLKIEPFMKDELVLIVPGSHEWALRDVIEPHELLSKTFIYPRRGSGTRDIIENRLAEAGIVLRDTLEIGHTEAVKKAVEEGLGVAILSKTALMREEHLGVLKSLRLAGVDLHRTFCFTYRKDKYLGKVAAAFLQFAVYQRSLT
ncbi:MAG: LysR family transcriptional regulator [Syntrophales bacterium]|nr:LysR family transcriptional regulator [Syntrophales bacterium]